MVKVNCSKNAYNPISWGVSWSQALKVSALGLLILSGQAVAKGRSLTPNGNPLLTMDEFAAISHTVKYPYDSEVTFERDPYFNYFYSPECDYRPRFEEKYKRDKIECDSFQSPYGQEKRVTFVKPKNKTLSLSDHEECLLLQNSIIRSHVVLALNGQLDDKSQYGPHHVVVCKNKCVPFGNLTFLSKFSKCIRDYFSGQPTQICPFVDSKKTSISVSIYQNLSAVVFGKVPETINNICLKLFGSLTQMEAQVLEVMQDILKI